MHRKLILALLFVSVATLASVLTACTEESRNQFWRKVENIPGQNLEVRIYSFSGKEVAAFGGVGKVTTGEDLGGTERPYIYFYDSDGRYVQTNMWYIAVDQK